MLLRRGRKEGKQAGRQAGRILLAHMQYKVSDSISNFTAPRPVCPGPDPSGGNRGDLNGLLWLSLLLLLSPRVPFPRMGTAGEGGLTHVDQPRIT